MPAPTESLDRTRALVELGLQACTAYGRPDLGHRLSLLRRRLADPGIHVVVTGEFKQGKSSLVNALVGAPCCPVDDDLATAVATYLRHGEHPSACLVYDGDPPRREPIAARSLRRHVVEPHRASDAASSTNPTAARTADHLIGVEVRLPRALLAGGLVLVDTPGLGGLASSHAAITLTAAATADALLFVTDASRELTAAEVAFLRAARDLCPAVLCVLTKIDLYPQWRTIRDLDQAHLATALPGVELVAVSSTLRHLAARGADRALNEESGFPPLVRFVAEQVTGDARHRQATLAAAEVISVCRQLEVPFDSERAVLVDPARSRSIIDDLAATRRQVDELRGAASRWNQTLSDGIADLTADVDHDLRRRIRLTVEAADEAIEAADPLDAWPTLEAWLESRTAHELVANYTLLKTRALALSDHVGQHFRDGSSPLTGLGVYDPTGVLNRQSLTHEVALERMTAGTQTMVALRSSYTGMLMFTVLGSLLHLSLGPLGVGVGLVMGQRGLKEEKKRRLEHRRALARQAVRRYCDDVQFVIGKDSRDTLRRIQRQLRDHYATRADELSRSSGTALRAATEAAEAGQSERTRRLRDVDAELDRLRRLRTMAEAIATPPSAALTDVEDQEPGGSTRAAG